jgi:hypothetical protein
MVRRFLLVVVALGVAGCLTYEGFLRKKEAKYCEMLAECNPDTPCEIPSATDTGYGDFDDCDFDSRAARDCLRGVWTCDDTFGPAWSYPLDPEVCSLVCGSIGVE